MTSLDAPTRVLSLRVRADFANAWLEGDEDVDLRTAALTFACALPRREVEPGVHAAIGQELDRRWMDEVRRWQARASDVEVELREERTRAALLEHKTTDHEARVRLEVMDSVRARCEEIERECATLRDERTRTEADLTEQLRVQLLRSTEHAERASRDAQELAALRAKVAELATPAARGRAGEVHVAETLRAVGFSVEDTSQGERKLKGYLDLLVSPVDGGPRIAVEVKNRDTIDPSTQIKPFEDKVRRGVREGLFESAIFLSLRAPTKKTSASSVHLEMFGDEAGRPLVPVSYLGPERGKVVFALLGEQVETHVSLHAALVVQCHALRRTLAVRGEGDEAKFQSFVDGAAAGFAGTLEDLCKQQRLVTDLQSNLTHMRSRTVDQCRALWVLNKEAACLERSLPFPWMPVFETLRDKVGTMTEAKAWSELSKEKQAQVERDIGQKAVFASVKRARRED